MGRRVAVLFAMCLIAAGCSGSGDSTTSDPSPEPDLAGDTDGAQEATSPRSLTIPRPDRARLTDPGTYEWPHHLVVVADRTGPLESELASTIETAAPGAQVSSTETLGIHLVELPADLDDAATSTIVATIGDSPGVSAVDRLRGYHDLLSLQDGPDQMAAWPPDWDDPRWDGIDVSWPFEMIGIDDLWAAGFRTAPDIGVLVADFGLLDTHPDLGFAAPPTAIYDDPVDDRLLFDITGSSHGTAVASIACGVSDGAGVVGVAQGCQLFGVDMLYSLLAGHEQTMTTSLGFAVLIDEMLAAHPSIRVVNMSWGFGPNPASNCERSATPVDVFVLHRLFTSHPDVAFVTAAGNCGIDLPAVDHIDQFTTDPVQYPAGAAALLDNIIAVTALDGDLTLPSWANNGAAVDVGAPGGASVNGDAMWAAAFDCGQSPCAPTYGQIAGTSLAAPFVSGLLALVFQADPTVETLDVKGCLSGGDPTASSDPPALDARATFECATGIDLDALLPVNRDIPDDAIFDERFPGLAGVPAPGGVFIVHDPDDDWSGGRCWAGYHAGVERSLDAALYSYSETREGLESHYVFNEGLAIDAGQFGRQPGPVTDTIWETGEPASRYFGYGWLTAIVDAPEGDWGPCIEQVERTRAREGFDAWDFRQWVEVSPYRPSPTSPGVELSTQWVSAAGDGTDTRCRYIVWWTVPLDWLDTGRTVSDGGQFVVEVTAARFDNALPDVDFFDLDGFAPYDTPGRAGFARHVDEDRANCAWVEYDLDRSITTTR